MKEIGGYIEFESYFGSVYHEGAVALNCGRNCLAYLIEVQAVKRIRLPYFLCGSVTGVCRKYGVETDFYRIGEDFRPITDFELRPDEWLYIVNYYGQLTNEEAAEYKRKYGRVIFDNAQSYFQRPAENVDTIYTCRKFFGVPDGGFVYTAKHPDRVLPTDESFERIHYILGRYERTAGEFYKESADNNHSFADEPIKKMSKLTENLLRSFDYDRIIARRTENFRYLHERLGGMNRLKLRVPEGAFMYPLYLENGAEVRKRLQQMKIFVPMLWGDVLEICGEHSLEYSYAKNILPLPTDQRYDKNDMEYMIARLTENGGTL
ncbi:hypothetical protein SAMN02910447_03203 [Ruminococcus sp. YE71]|uniref:hypothetical protein n=1 Tax=unclassified Ruminococcus TaxID=2608920 RepID=UPI0008909EB6|nr:MULTISPECIES: hypothetical protein [unclassified Ruminococcus]SDA30706.1 hypothetical protein SAMN02910446_03318 [Ruminococcus sp. YE78]SFW49841.1 hypothetical protein SAMN02910447_03203 [Ruminococcus sp. YE71]